MLLKFFSLQLVDFAALNCNTLKLTIRYQLLTVSKELANLSHRYQLLTKQAKKL